MECAYAETVGFAGLLGDVLIPFVSGVSGSDYLVVNPIGSSRSPDCCAPVV